MSQQSTSRQKRSDLQILIIDYDKETRQQSASVLLEAGFKVSFAESFQVAKEILDAEPVDAIVSELDMPGQSSVEFVKWVRRIYDRKSDRSAPTPFIILTGSPESLEQKGLDNYRMQGCLFKPVDQEDLLERVHTVLKLNEESSQPKSANPELLDIKVKPSEYCRVLLADFVSQKHLKMNVYIRLGKEKYVQVAKKQDPVNEAQFRRYLQKGLKYFFVRTADYKMIVDHNLQLAKAVTASSQLGGGKKKRILAAANEVILESVFVRGVNKDTFNEAHTYICTSINTLLDHKDGVELLEVLNQHNDFLYAHSLGVSLYSVMIAQQMGWSSGNNLYKLSIGGLLHDIGKCEIDREIVNKPKSDLTFSEKALLETHCERGRNLLEKIKSIPSEVVNIAYEHHENILGQGFPRGLTKARITPMAKIVQTADEFCHLAIENPDHSGTDAASALSLLEQYKHDILDPETLRALRNRIRVPEKTSA